MCNSGDPQSNRPNLTQAKGTPTVPCERSLGRARMVNAEVIRSVPHHPSRVVTVNEGAAGRVSLAAIRVHDHDIRAYAIPICPRRSALVLQQKIFVCFRLRNLN
jgi:hypothetical protein